jgi:hypothetical protein
VGNGVVSNTEFAYLNGVTSSIQTQLNALAAGSITTRWNAAQLAFFNVISGTLTLTVKDGHVGVTATVTSASPQERTATNSREQATALIR